MPRHHLQGCDDVTLVFEKRSTVENEPQNKFVYNSKATQCFVLSELFSTHLSAHKGLK